MNDSNSQLSFKVQRVSEERTKRWYAFVFAFVDWVVTFIPTHRDTAKGRQNALQIRAILIICGVVIVAFAGRTWVPLGVAVMALALIAPMAEMRRRSLRSKLKRAQTKTTLRRQPARVLYDGRRVQFRDDSDKTLRRVLTDRGDHQVLERSFNGRLAIGIKGPGTKKREQIWLITADSAVDEEQALTHDDIDMRIEAELDDVEKLLKAMDSA